VDGIYFSLVTESTIESQEVALIIFEELDNFVSKFSLFWKTPVKVLHMNSVSFKEFQRIEIFSDDTFEGFHGLELGKESLESYPIIFQALTVVALDSLNSGEPGEVIILHHLNKNVGQVAITSSIDSQGVNGLELSEDINILLG